MHIQSALLLGLATLLFACAEQPTSYAPRYGSYDGPEYATPAYGYAPGYPGPDYGGSDLFMGGAGYWASGEDRDPYWYHRHDGDRDRAWQEHELRRGENDAQTPAQVWQQLQQQKAAAQAAQTQALQGREQAAQRMYEQRAQTLAAQQQALSAARARGLIQ